MLFNKEAKRTISHSSPERYNHVLKKWQEKVNNEADRTIQRMTSLFI